MRILLCAILFFFPFVKVPAQNVPDISTIKNHKDKLAAWDTYCGKLLTGENYKELINASRKGIVVCDTNDKLYQSRFLYNIAYGYEYSNNSYDSAIAYYEQAYRYAVAAKDMHEETNVLMRLNYLYYSIGKFSQRDSLLKYIKAFADTTKNLYTLAVLNGSIGEYYLDNSQYENFIFYKLKAIDYRKKLRTENADDNRENIGVSYLQVASAYLNMKQPDKAIEYLQYSTEYIVKYKSAKFFVCNEYLEAFTMLNKPDSAIKYYRKLYALVTPDDSMYLNLSYANRIMAEYYLSHKETDSAYRYSLLAARFADASKDNEIKVEAQATLGSVLYEKKEYKEAIAVLEKIIPDASAFDKNMYRKALQQLAFCYKALQKWQEASYYMERYSSVSDSLNEEMIKKNIAETEAKYQNKEKQQQIESKNGELSIARTRTLWLTTGLLMLIAVAVLLGIIYRNKRITAATLDKQNKTLAILNRNLEEANATKARLFSIISHDLRSPISQVYQFLKLQQLNPKLLSEEQRAQLSQRIQEATGSLLETMEDLLLWSKTQMAGFETKMTTVLLLPIVEQCLHLLQLNSESKELLIKNEVAATTTVYADAYFLQTILRNLLQNAIKASPENGVIKIHFYEIDSQPALTICNEGKPFTQSEYKALLADAETGKSLSGLGLRLVNELSEKMSATISFSAKSDNGTCATVRFSLNKS